MQPENGGLSVVAHEYGHDLGLPDHYDTSGPSARNENPVGWWNLMAQSRVSAPGDNAIGSRAADLSAWDKLQLGWLDYEVVVPGQNRVLDLGPHEYNSAKAQAAVVVLPGQDRRHRPRRPVRGHQAVVLRRRRRPELDDVPFGDPAGRDLHAVLPGPLEHRGLRRRPV